MTLRNFLSNFFILFSAILISSCAPNAPSGKVSRGAGGSFGGGGAGPGGPAGPPTPAPDLFVGTDCEDLMNVQDETVEIDCVGCGLGATFYSSSIASRGFTIYQVGSTPEYLQFYSDDGKVRIGVRILSHTTTAALAGLGSEFCITEQVETQWQQLWLSSEDFSTFVALTDGPQLQSNSGVMVTVTFGYDPVSLTTVLKLTSVPLYPSGTLTEARARGTLY